MQIVQEGNNMDITHNPYLNRAMIRDIEDFYGRKREVARIYSRIGTAHPQSVSIVGTRRIGKSSLLNFIYQEANRKKYLRNPQQYKFLLIDFQERKNITLPEFFGSLFELLSREFQGELDITEDPSYEGLKEVVTKIQREGFKLILLFDEFDSITKNENFDMEFFAFLRALANRYDVAYIVSSGRRLQEFCHTKDIADSPFFNIFSNLFLSPFSRQEALELICEPSKAVDYPLDAVADIILSMAGYFPFFLQIACSVFFEYALDYSVSPEDIPLSEILDVFLEEASDHFEYIWEHSPADQQQVLLQLAEGKRPPESQQYLVKELHKQGYVLLEENQQRLFSELFKEYILQQAAFETPEASEEIERIERIEQELQDAQAMQRSILPSEEPIFTGLDISSYFRPATEIGGDYYDYIPLTETELGVAIGDVKGHGMSAGLLVSTASGCLHTTLEKNQSIKEVMRVMNRRVYEVKGRMFMTFCFSVFDTANRTLTLSSAGHPFPYHYRASTHNLLPLQEEGSLPLGVLQDCDCPVYSHSLETGDVLVYYSDGLIECTNAQLQLFGFEQLENAIMQSVHHAASDIKQAILDEFFAHCQQHEQEDDVTLIVIKFSNDM